MILDSKLHFAVHCNLENTNHQSETAKQGKGKIKTARFHSLRRKRKIGSEGTRISKMEKAVKFR